MTDSDFKLIRERAIPSLRVNLQEYRHRGTAARHFHLAAEDNNNVFLVAFLTVPQDSSGVAHILEHTALCGSQRYPVRDPFFMMNRRSLNTFMNAFTSADWTAYPFASQNKKDFNNLLDVYLDAAFFPLLDELDFAQEGHRVEFAKPADPNSALVYKGVVFNEMKGAMSSPTRLLAQSLQSALFPTITYHYNSGGEPEEIPNLTYQQLKEFHSRHYHPSNAVFMTYGDIPVEEHQQRFQDRVLKNFSAQDFDFSVSDEQRFSAPKNLSEQYALDGEQDLKHKTHIVVGWLLGKNTDIRDVLEAQILSDVLLDNSSSPLRHALETCKLGTAPSPVGGIDEDTREISFACGLEGSDPEHADAVEALILEVITQVAEQGVAYEVLESVLHQLELSQREVTGDGFPYGLQLILQALTPAMHGGDPVAALDIDDLLNELREDIKNPQFIKDLARRLLLDNPHRVRLVMAPDKDFNQRQNQSETERLAKLRQQLSEAQQSHIVEMAQALEQRQQQQDDAEILPRVTLADVPADFRIVEGEDNAVNDLPVSWYAQGTNGMVYQQLIADLPQFDDDLLDLLPMYTLCMTEVGVNGHDYLTIQARQAALTGGISAGCTARGNIDDPGQLRAVLTLSAKALARNQEALTELMFETFSQARFDELPRLRELVAQWRAQRQQSVTGHGHALAMMAAGATLNPVLALSHRWDGLAGIEKLQALDDSLDDENNLNAIAEKLVRIHQQMQTAPRRMLVVSEAEQHDAIAGNIARHQHYLAAVADIDAFTYDKLTPGKALGWSTTTQVSFSAKAYPTVALDHADAPALQVLGNFLRNGYLHRAIREKGGAYGVSAGYHGDSGTFRFFSYRDPRFEETLEDFDQSLLWLQQSNHSERALEEAILGVISAIDRPGSPAGEAITAFYAGFFGRTPAFRRAFRKQILDVSLDDLKRVAQTYFAPEQSSQAAVSSAEILERQQNWEISAL